MTVTRLRLEMPEMEYRQWMAVEQINAERKKHARKLGGR